jgi:hypothetical protein
MRQKIEIRIATIEKNGDHAKTKLNLEVDLVPKCGLVEPFRQRNQTLEIS